LGLSSVIVTWSNTSSIFVNATSSNNYHQLHISDGELKEMDLIIPNKGSVIFQNNGDRVEEIKLNLQLTYTAIYR